MQRQGYLDDLNVRGFLDWVEPLVSDPRGIHIAWDSKGCHFRCQSFEEAYRKYCWYGKVELDDGSTITVKDFEGTARRFDRWQEMMSSILQRGYSDNRNQALFFQTAKRIRQWGGIRRHGDLDKLGGQALTVLGGNAARLHPDSADTEDLRNLSHMGSGYSKVYAMMVPGLPIYDSRVACALTSLILTHCRELELPQVPETLQLGIPQSPGKQPRNPSVSQYHFPNIWDSSKYGGAYAVSNVKAAWLIGELATRCGPFSSLPPNRHSLALQSALFMIGYRCFDEQAFGQRRG